MKSLLAAVPLVLLATACNVPMSDNHYVGKTDEYACPLPNGNFELKSDTMPVANCAKLSDLPESDQEAIKSGSATTATVDISGHIHILGN